MASEVATFGAGCFWGVEAAFAKLEGVTKTTAGYSGGKMDLPTYKDVCTGTTGHAEVVRVEFDSERICYEELLDAFFTLHDPTTLNRQGPDWGEQYRSVIFFHTPQQQAAAQAKIAALTALGAFHSRKIVTAVEPAGAFWPAEEYHQRYLEKCGRSACHL
jgi:peptide-methionine (S)-S-oxide reductase